MKIPSGIMPQIINMTGILGEGEQAIIPRIKELNLQPRTEKQLLNAALFAMAATAQTAAIFSGSFFLSFITKKDFPSLSNAAFNGVLSTLVIIDSYHGSMVIHKVADITNRFFKKLLIHLQ